MLTVTGAPFLPLSIVLCEDGDFVVEFETYLRRYALVVVLADSTNMGWKECQAMADAMRVAERGTNINNHSFCNIFDTLKEKYGAVNGPLVENRRLVGLILPGPGDLRIKTGNVLSGLSFSFDSDGDILFKANTYSGKKFTIVQQLIGKNKSMMVMDCKAFIDILGMLETGDHVDELTFVSLVGALRTKYNFVKLGKVSGTLYASVVASRVANSEPIESVLLKAMQAKAPSKSRSTDTSPSVGASPSLPTCPYRGLSYTRALQESGQAQVYAGLGPDGEKVAIKVFKGSEEDASEGYRTELRMLLKMKEHRNVIECLQFFENPKPALVMRLVEGSCVRIFNLAQNDHPSFFGASMGCFIFSLFFFFSSFCFSELTSRSRPPPPLSLLICQARVICCSTFKSMAVLRRRKPDALPGSLGTVFFICIEQVLCIEI